MQPLPFQSSLASENRGKSFSPFPAMLIGFCCKSTNIADLKTALYRTVGKHQRHGEKKLYIFSLQPRC